MSKIHDAQQTSSLFGNPFKLLRPRGSYLSPMLITQLTSFEQNLTQSLKKLKPENSSETLTLSWMRHAAEVMCEIHTNIKTLTADLQFPVSDWDEKWMDTYLDNTVKLLDICNALTSELARMDQTQLLLKYAVHILASTDEPGRGHSALHEYLEKIHLRSPKLESCYSILQELAATLELVKVKNSAKGKVLMRAMYGVKAVSIFICSVFTAALSGCPKPLVDLNVTGEFLWADALNSLQSTVNGEIRDSFSHGKSGALKELQAVNCHVKTLHDASIITNGQNLEGWKQSCLDLASGAECFATELDLLSKQVERFFHVVLDGRNALLLGLTSGDVQREGKANRFR